MELVPSLAELAQYNVNRPDQVEAIRQSIYDRQTYVAAGQTNLTYFAQPQSSTKFLDATNMEAAGSLPAPKSFLMESIELYLFPPTVEIAGAAASVTAFDDFIADTYNVYKGGWLELFIGSKPYLDEAPLMKFPPRCGMSGWASLAATTTADTTSRWISYASASGPTYQLAPPILLVPTQNFKVTLNWPTVIAITADALLMVSLGGILYRNSQ